MQTRYVLQMRPNLRSVAIIQVVGCTFEYRSNTEFSMKLTVLESCEITDRTGIVHKIEQQFASKISG